MQLHCVFLLTVIHTPQPFGLRTRLPCPYRVMLFTSTATLRVNCFAFVAKHQASLCFTHLTSTFLPSTMYTPGDVILSTRRPVRS